MIWQAYEQLLQLQKALAERLTEEAKNSQNPFAAAEKANAELAKLRLEIKETEKKLFSSNHPYDKVYRMRFIQGKRVEVIAQATHQGEASVYRILRKLKVDKK